MKFDPSQLEQYRREGYVIVDCPFPEQLTAACLAAVDKVAIDPEQNATDSRGNHYRLKPQVPGSYWCDLDHSLCFLQIELHAEIVELARQLADDEDIYFRNGGINELAPGRSFKWHRDAEDDYVEFMHYFSGAKRGDGCLRVIPGSHIGPIRDLQAQVEQRRRQSADADPASVHVDDVELTGETALEIGRHQLIVRSSRIFHSTWVNRSDRARLMHHWLFRESAAANHRFDFSCYLTSELIEQLTDEQRRVLWLGRQFEFDDKWEGERERELGTVQWSIV